VALQNRVTPAGEIVADPARGLFMGNRGILHDDAQRLGRVRWRHKSWITCLLDFKGRQRTIMSPRRYTELFFLDEAVALAAGHRPCAECRRCRFSAFLDAWVAGTGHDVPPPKAPALDAALHAARLEPGTRRQRTYQVELAALPDGVFIRLEDAPLYRIVLSRRGRGAGRRVDTQARRRGDIRRLSPGAAPKRTWPAEGSRPPNLMLSNLAAAPIGHREIHPIPR
jgi:hypothetical protein